MQCCVVWWKLLDLNLPKESKGFVRTSQINIDYTYRHTEYDVSFIRCWELLIKLDFEAVAWLV